MYVSRYLQARPVQSFRGRNATVLIIVRSNFFTVDQLDHSLLHAIDYIEFPVEKKSVETEKNIITRW